MLRGKLQRGRYGFPLIVCLIGLAATAAVALQVQHTIDVQDQERFSLAVDNLQDDVTNRLETYITALRAGAGALGGEELNLAAFHALTERLQLAERLPGVQGLGFSVRIRPDTLPDVIAGQRRAGSAQFDVWPAGEREEYHSILYLEPLDRRNRAAIGYDMFTEPTRREAMERARDTGTAAATGPVTLVQEIDERKQPGFLIYLPVYEGGQVPPTVAERRERLRGFVYSPFRTTDLFAGLLGRNPRQRAGVELSDAGVMLHRTHDTAGDLTTTRTIDVAGRSWRAEYFSTPALHASSSSALVALIASGGVAVSLLLTALAWLETRARARAEGSEAAADDASRRFQQLANSIPQLAWMARPDGFIYWYNDRWFEYTGTTPEQMAGWGWQSVQDPDYLPAVLDGWRTSIRTGEPFEMEFPLRRADGRFRIFLTRVAPFRDAHGAIVHWFGTNTDVQYRRDAERALQEQADTLAILNRTGAHLAAELDLERLLQAVTDAGTQLARAQFGALFYNTVNREGEAYTLYTLSGVPREAFAQFPMPRNTAVFGPTFRGEGAVRSDDITADARYGRSAPYNGMPAGHLPVKSYLAVPVRSRSGEVLGGLFFGHAQPAVFTQQSEDIVGGIAAQAAIAIDNARLYKQVHELLESERSARAEAERVSHMKDEFLATLSHELRTPLNAVVGWAHMLTSLSMTDEKRLQAVDTILRNARIQSQLIEDLLDMSRIISGRLRIDMNTVDLREVIDGALNVVRQTAEAKRVSLHVEVPEGRSLVRGDSNRLQQVVWNLLTNAIKFTPPGGIVTVTLDRHGEDARLSVTDTGIGIDPAFLSHVFERFRQADASYTRGHGGLGLGLSIVRSLVEMHGGSVQAASDGDGSGSTFTVCLPAAQPGLEPETPRDGRRAPSRPVDASILRGVTALVVDDDRDSRDLAREVLSQHGARVATASSGPEALQVVEAEPRPDVLVCDLGMPEMDGYELIQRLRASGVAAPAIALTAFAGAEDQTRAIAAGFDVHLSKPYRPEDLIAACTTLMPPSVP